MTYNLNNSTSPLALTFGIEIETGGISYPQYGRLLAEKGLKGFKSVDDGSGRVDAEIVTCPLTPCDTAWEFISNLTRAMNEIGTDRLGDSNRLINTGCGLHVHVGNAFLNDGVDPDEYCRKSIEAFGTTGARYHLDHQDPMEFEIYRDVAFRCSYQQDVLDSMNYKSRRNNRYCSPIGIVLDDIKAASDRQQLAAALRRADINYHSKFSAITLETWGKGTIEFRQHGGTTDATKIRRWVEFILNLFAHTIENRIENGGDRTIVHNTPVDPFRRLSRIGVQYRLKRSPEGATTRAIMDATGCSEQRVRAAVSEIRNHAEVGQAAVVTHTQQANGATYGDGTDHTRYQVLESFETQAQGAVLMPENRIGIPSVWAGINDDHFAWWQDRIEKLSRSDQ